MSNRYLVQICTPAITSIIVVADTETEARERAFNGEGNPQEQWTEEAYIKAVTPLED